MTLRRVLTLAAITAAPLGLPSAGWGAATFGSSLADPVTADNLGGYCGTVCTGANLNLPAANTAPGGLRAPFAGVIVTWRVRSGSAGNPVALRVLRQAAGTTFSGAGTSAAGTTTTGVAAFATRLKVRKDDSIGLDPRNGALVWSSSTPGASGVVWGSLNAFPNGLADGSAGAGDAQTGKELLVQAVIEADADDDGYGDETQDSCPGDPARQAAPCGASAPPTPAPGTPPGPVPGPGPAMDVTPPVLTALAVRPRTLRAGRRTRIAFRVSERSRVTLSFARLSAGRRRGGGCRPQSRRVRTGRRCTASVSAGSVVLRADGPKSIVFGGRVGGRTLAPGRYRLAAKAADGAGNVSRRVTASFTVRARGR